MTTPASPGQSWSWHATLRSVHSALGVDDVDRARELLADARRPGRLRYGLQERLTGVPRLVRTTMQAIDVALTVDESYAQAARACVRSGLAGLPEERPATWSQLRAVRRQLSLARSMAWLVPAKAREAVALQQALDEASAHLAGAAEQAARLQATLGEIQRVAAKMRADADALSRTAVQTDRGPDVPPEPGTHDQ
jgi:hypothetical protein